MSGIGTFGMPKYPLHFLTPKSSGQNRPIFLPKFPICLSPFLFGQKPNKPGKPTSRTWCFFQLSGTGKILSLEGPSKLWTSDPSPLFHILQHWSCKEMNLSPKQPIRRYNCPDSSIVRSSCCVDTICAKCNLGIYPWPYLPFAELIVWCWCQRSQAASTTESVWPCLKKGSRHG